MKNASTYVYVTRNIVCINSYPLYSPLCLAAMQASYPEFVQLLLDQGANPNGVDTELGTPLFCACKANNPAAASILLKASKTYYIVTVIEITHTFVEADHSIRNAQGIYNYIIIKLVSLLECIYYACS